MRTSLKHHLPCLAILLLTLLLLFFRSFDPQLTLNIGDDSMAVVRNHYRLLPTLFTGSWSATFGLGNPGAPTNPSPGFWLSYLVPYFKYVDANAFLHMFILGLAGYFFIHDYTRNRFASLSGGFFLMLQPHVLSHLLPGHVGHFIMAGWIVPSFLFTRRAVLNGGLFNWALTGTCFGLLLAAGQHDVAAFIGLALAAYGLCLLVIRVRSKSAVESWLATSGGIALAVILTVLLSYQSIFGNLLKQLAPRAEATADQSGQTDKMSANEQWLWATQWSIPPVETIDAAVPGFFGWGSSNPTNPYRGRIGQTEGWMEHRQGLPNLNDVCQYLGAVMLLGVLLAFLYRRRDPEVWFFAVAGVLALLLSYGKFAPLYRFFYAIPGMESMRNPIKWYYVTSLCAGILGALGWAAVTRADRPALSRPRAALTAFLPGLAIIGLAALMLTRFEANPFPFWQQPSLVTLSARSIGLAALIWGLAGMGLFLILSAANMKNRSARAGMGLVLLVLIGELAAVNVHYMPYHPWANETKAGPFNDFLATSKQPYRFRFLRQDGVFYLLREIANMEGMELADPYASRLSDPYLNLQRIMEPADPFKFWRLSNVRYIVSPGSLNNPAFKPVLTLKAGSTTVTVSEFRDALPRCFWVSSWRKATEKDAPALMKAPTFDPGREALIHEPAPSLPEPPADADTNAVCRIVHYEWSRIRLETTSTSPGLVVCLNRFDPDFKALVDGKPVPLWKTDAIMQSCAVPAGRHTVEFAYEPEGGRKGLAIIAAGWLLAGATILVGILLRRRQLKEVHS